MLFPHRKQSMGLLNWLAVFMWNLAWCCLVVFNILKAVWKVRQGQVNATKCSPQFACWSQFIKKKERNGLGGKRDPVNILQLVFWSSWLLVSASEIQSHWCSAIHYTVSLMPASPYNHMNFNSCISIRPIRILCKCVQMQIKPSVSHYVKILIGKEKQSSPPGCSTYPSVFCSSVLTEAHLLSCRSCCVVLCAGCWRTNDNIIVWEQSFVQHWERK